MCANASGIELWYWHGLVASGWNYDIGALQANGSGYWIMILVHFDGTGIELWYGLLSANSSLCVISLSIMTSVARSIAGLQTLTRSVTSVDNSLQNLAALIHFMLSEYTNITWLTFSNLPLRKRWIKAHICTMILQVQNWRVCEDVK